MPLPLIGIAASILGNVAPTIVGKLFGDGGEKIAEQVVDFAQEVTGTGSPHAAQIAISENPELAAKLQEKLIEERIVDKQEGTKRIVAVNETMRAELSSKDPYNSRWRATFGYIVAISFGVQMIGVTILILWKPAEAAAAINAIAGLTMLWNVALAVLGITVHKRSQDKQTAAGSKPSSLLSTIASRIGGGNA